MALFRFWTMLTHYHGQIWNAAEPARSLGVSEPTPRRYLDLLIGVFMVRQLKPRHANLSKRQVKAPKVYLRDSGLLHHRLGIRTRKDSLSHPKSGSSWEGFALDHLAVIYTGETIYPLGERVTVWPPTKLAEPDGLKRLLRDESQPRAGVRMASRKK